MSQILSLLTVCIFICCSHAIQKCCKVRTIETLNLGNADSFTLLTKTGITNVATSSIVGNVGSYPITGAAIHLTCPEVAGIVYQADASGATCFVTSAAYLLSAIGDMETAYTAANSLANYDFQEFHGGDVSGLTLTRGLYKWTTSVLINANVYLFGSSSDVWVFQIAGNLVQASMTNIILQGGAKSKNIFWVVAGASVDVGAGALFQGSILAKGGINLITGATIYGRLFSQTAVTLQMNSIDPNA